MGLVQRPPDSSRGVVVPFANSASRIDCYGEPVTTSIKTLEKAFECDRLIGNSIRTWSGRNIITSSANRRRCLARQAARAKTRTPCIRIDTHGCTSRQKPALQIGQSWGRSTWLHRDGLIDQNGGISRLVGQC